MGRYRQANGPRGATQPSAIPAPGGPSLRSGREGRDGPLALWKWPDTQLPWTGVPTTMVASRQASAVLQRGHRREPGDAPRIMAVGLPIAHRALHAEDGALYLERRQITSGVHRLVAADMAVL